MSLYIWNFLHALKLQKNQYTGYMKVVVHEYVGTHTWLYDFDKAVGNL
jgi:hypothetical protein